MNEYLINGFSLENGVSCFSSNLQKLLKFKGWDFSEFMISGLLEYLSFSYYPELILSNEFIKGALSKEQLLLGNLKRNLNINFKTHEHVDRDIAWLVSKQQIIRNNPVLVSVNDFYLDYSEYFKRIHNIRTIVLVGFKEKGSLVHVFDIEPRIITLENLQNARNFSEKGEDIKNRWFELKLRSKPGSVEYAIISSISEVCDKMLRKQDTGNISGVDGIKYFAADLGMWINRYDEETVRDILFNTYKFLSRPSGTKTSRNLFGNFLKEASVLLRLNDLELLAEEFLELVNLWEIIANLCFKASRSDYQILIPRLQKRINAIAITEEQLYSDLKNAIVKTGEIKI